MTFYGIFVQTLWGNVHHNKMYEFYLKSNRRHKQEPIPSV